MVAFPCENMLAVIGGSGFYSIGKTVDKIDVITNWGVANVHRVKLFDEEFLFVPRHGTTHRYPPHNVNYRANIRALHKLGATAIFSTYAGGIISKYKPGDLVMLEDFIGFHTPISFFNDFSSGIRHKDVSEPFNKDLSTLVSGIAHVKKIKLKKGGIIASTTGPRYESKAEINALKKMGANLVNMTAAYEIILANEIEIPICGVMIGANYACGINKKRLHHEDVILQVTKIQNNVNSIIETLVQEIY